MDVARNIDNTWLKLDNNGFDEWLEESRKHQFNSICVRKENIEKVVKCCSLKDSKIDTVTVVVNFPNEKITDIKQVGTDLDTGVVELGEVYKLYKEACEKHKCHPLIEIDWVSHISDYFESPQRYIDDLVALRNYCDQIFVHDFKTKIIIESCYLDFIDVVFLCGIIKTTGHDYLKSSTGYADCGAELEKFDRLKKYCINGPKIKVAGGIKDFSTACGFLSAGMDVIGTSNGLSIVKEAQNE